MKSQVLSALVALGSGVQFASAVSKKSNYPLVYNTNMTVTGRLVPCYSIHLSSEHQQHMYLRNDIWLGI